MKVRNIRKIILAAAVCSVFLTACGSETSSEKAFGAESVSDRTEAPTEVTAAENTTEEIDIKVPENAAYRQTELKYIEGMLSTISFSFYDEHDKCIYYFSQQTDDSNEELTETFDCSYSYKYNDDGTIAEINSVSSFYNNQTLDNQTLFEYRDDKTIRNKTYYYNRNGKPWYTSVCTYDENSNPVWSETTFVNSNKNYSSTYEYEYDSEGRILVEKCISDNDLYNCTKRYTYDDNGNTASLEATYAGSDFPQLTKYTYNSENRLIKEEFFVFGEKASYTEYTEYEYEFYN